MTVELPDRPGEKPETTHPTLDQPHPHTQLDQNASGEMQEALFRRAATLDYVEIRDSCVSVPGARAFHLDRSQAGGPAEAFQCQFEFAHIHPQRDGSLHLTLPRDLRDEVLNKGWGEPHPISGTMMLFGPRDAGELEVAWDILQASYLFARGLAI